MEKEIVKRYEKDDFTIVWKPKMCSHSAICAKGLSSVFDPHARPWINTEGASIAEMKAQIDQCPSGALSYEHKVAQAPAALEVTKSATSVRVNKGASLLVEGPLEITMPDGNVEVKDVKASFCRCGASQNKPFCDGSHRELDFGG